ncbi:glycosyl transferase family 1 : Glycosyltransferase OS=Singulisphaera acidiphila (strain ATCC BAA-1392 / DSM 18658 / VKM B-2454 / MOB10) GN=Sinac_1453 PE=4 SV=1: Glycos_transf_1 [Gemmataceae bacterium]|nr:glycosyl transferase family 1 : Glycosyltransferase OS=Singulisphaera acidiphila (strain ATCC BAA-1392 / DSM 18658 / VKM B-2454 / MOB10) GN=Sinac_1453 PE=4 SV=1: Glycos_transf_1 [Gemmataceae bacterium]VTT97022.1 glycosyl transferase family 1 : Glycosyltransferase OS=Singulisphaera acidiphila (strain ATCC BAA-1392 / DSM 18658 / VKM B-2454 / MOB10) GN=Sinac_1453 PE=4 SV=1: Glycos_transf_1 [Gemmataceae bacterium]
MDAGERVVLVHDWLTGMRGGEKCLEPLCRRWPASRLLTLLHKPGSVSPAIEQARITPSVLNALPKVERYYRYLLPLMPFVAGWRVEDADLVVSLSHAVAKSANPPQGVPHVCYCFTPMRYAWHMQESYFAKKGVLGGLKARAIDLLMGRIREWDRRTASRVTHFVAISNTVRDRIRDCYGRDAAVIYPPVDTEFYRPSNEPREDFYLVVSALAPYKRFDLAVDACQKLGRKLVVIGSGQHLAKLKAQAGPTTRFLGWQSDEVIRDHLRRAKALLFPGEEDFGIVPLEAQACGCPVIGFGRGGLTETVRPLGESATPTAVVFHEQNLDAVATAIETFEREADRFDPRAARRQAVGFRKDRFETELFEYLDGVIGQKDVRRAA